jgi:alpha-tubulin suppressor-like RCC1 family protein
MLPNLLDTAAETSLCWAENGKARMKAIKHVSRTGILSAVAFVACGLVVRVAAAATVNATYNSANDVPVTASSYTATGNTVNFTLNCALDTGTDLMVVQNTGLDFINGTFDNLGNGQPVSLNYGGVTYSFVANYYGGSGNDLVLVWANNRAFAWGANGGQLGDSTMTERWVPVPVTATGILAGKTVLAIAAGYGHSLALCSDGTLAAWGLNNDGPVGTCTAGGFLAPVAVNCNLGTSALYGKRVVSIAAGAYHSLALCSDGTVAAWGNGYYGALGTSDGRCVKAVSTASGVSALYGKTVVAIAAGWHLSLALCSDGTVAAWGRNNAGQLGDNTTIDRHMPVAVNTGTNSALYGKTVVAITAGFVHSAALCSDGTVAAWGSYPPNSPVPVVVNTGTNSALHGKTVVATAAGGYYSVARCSDGGLAAWGYNACGQLGDNTTINHYYVPVAVNTDSGVSALCGKTAVAIAAGYLHSLALCSDGTLAAWGGNNHGQLGDNTTTNRLVPVEVNNSTLVTGERFVRVAACSADGQHTLAVVAAPPPPAPIITVTGNGVTIANGDTTPSLTDGTDFGRAVTGEGTVVRTFTVQNIGNAPLNLTGSPNVAVSGPHAADFSVTLQPSSPVATNGTTTFQVTFTPGAYGLRTVTLSIGNDTDQNPYTFTIQGAGGCNPVPVLVETFDGAALDPGRWRSDGAELQGGQLVLDIPANGPSSGGITSAFRLWGDIDVQVEFDFTLWPANSGIHLAGLSLDDGFGWDYLSAARVWEGGSQIDVGIIGQAQQNEVGATNATGKYRLTRLGNQVSAYAWDWDTASWRTLISGSVAAPVESVLQIGWWNGPFSQPLRLTFDNLRIDACVLLPFMPRIRLNSAQTLTNGSFLFSFTNDPGVPFTVLGTTNLAEPLSNWMVVTGVTEVSSGQFQFTDPEMTNGAARFYRVRSP